jgi:hypothetical protein
LGLAVLYCLPQARYFPSPRVTDNIAVNEKLAFAKAHFPDSVDVLAIGSSMTMNNLNSGAVMDHFGAVRYLNAGAWGIGASELEVIGPLLAQRFRPKTVVVSTNLMDFVQEVNIIAKDSASIARYLHEPEISGYLRHWDAPYYLREMETNRIRFDDAGNYEFLGYDQHGGATLDIPRERINTTRYNVAPPTAQQLSPERYAAFARFAKDLHHRGIQLIVLESAYRNGVRTADSDALQQAHVARLRTLIEPFGGTVIDANQRRWDDRLYVDSSHLGPEGSKAYTAYCLAQLNATH